TVKDWRIPNCDAQNDGPTSTHLANTLRLYNSNIINFDKNVHGLNGMPTSLKYIPLGQSLNVYCHLLDIYCYFSQKLDSSSLFAAFRLIHRLARAGYSSNTFSGTPPDCLQAQDLEFLSRKTTV
ncbi:hypothetical protein MXB_3198, partial [Myxobolus squamalis]